MNTVLQFSSEFKTNTRGVEDFAFPESRPSAEANNLQTIGTLGVELKHPIAHNLQPDTADPGRIGAWAAIIDLRECQKTAGLIGIA